MSSQYRKCLPGNKQMNFTGFGSFIGTFVFKRAKPEITKKFLPKLVYVFLTQIWLAPNLSRGIFLFNFLFFSQGPHVKNPSAGLLSLNCSAKPAFRKDEPTGRCCIA